MSEVSKPAGSVTWMDLTVPDAESVREFYQAVTGWKAESVAMGGYNDYCMQAPATGETVAGICHARGANAGLPPQWLIYITVANMEQSLERCREMGGKILQRRDDAGQGSFAVIADPAGAAVALFQPAGGQ